MTEMKFICLYESYRKLFQTLTDAQAGRLVKAMLEYAYGGEVTELKGREELAFLLVRSQLDRDRERYEKICERNRKNVLHRWQTARAAQAEDTSGIQSKRTEEIPYQKS